MRITEAEVIRLGIPFSDEGEGLFHRRWRCLDLVLLGLRTDTDLVGRGETFSDFCAAPMTALTRRPSCRT